MKAVILAGGHGTRLSEETVVKPKPMVEIGARPILWHIMKHYSHHGFKEFLVALGYRGEVIKSYFLNYHILNRDISVDLATGATKAHDAQQDDWRVHLIDTGLGTQTGGRIKRLRQWLDGETFLMTYGDGVCNVDLKELIAFHRKQGRLATITAVRPPARFGDLNIVEDRVTAFAEKPQAGGGWINGGYMVIEPQVLDWISNDDTSFEKGVLERLAQAGQLAAFLHDDFWQCMDTLRDKNYLEGLWSSNRAPWKVWDA